MPDSSTEAGRAARNVPRPEALRQMRRSEASRARAAPLPLLLLILAALLAAALSTARPARAADELPTAPAADTEMPAPQRPVAVTPVAADAEIAARLQRILEASGWFTAPRVGVREGIAFLDGTTTAPEHRRWATSLAENTEAVIAVVNRIEVEADVRSTFERAGGELAKVWRWLLQAWPVAILALVIIAATWGAAKGVTLAARRLLAPRIASPLLLTALVRAAAVPVFVLGIYFVLQVAGLTRLAITVLGGTGLIGIIIGFAFRDIAENLLASLLLSMRNPFRTGDLIEVAGETGVVQNLNTRSTVLLTLDGNHVQIPNATVFKSTIRNYSSIPSRRAEFTVGIAYDSPATRAQALIAEVLANHPAVLDAPEPLVLIDELGAATVNLRVYYWFDSTTYSPAKINSALMRLAKNALIQGGIELPDSEREVIFPRGVPLIRAPGGAAPAPQPARPAEA
ncbi:mechanosensitive ion channel domain-containing protein, partial [Desertibaculum subflavum]|uniref:mechanosensitive ion channel domain-containing protein n=1 Tax=Desertibaculum subflavum TaxID=2268458 RepID=UPI0034D23BDF